MPQKIAAFLKLDSPKKYTGHSFRKSSATMVANKGASLIEIKQLGDWKSSAVAESIFRNKILLILIEITLLLILDKIIQATYSFKWQKNWK